MQLVDVQTLRRSLSRFVNSFFFFEPDFFNLITRFQAHPSHFRRPPRVPGPVTRQHRPSVAWKLHAFRRFGDSSLNFAGLLFHHFGLFTSKLISRLFFYYDSRSTAADVPSPLALLRVPLQKSNCGGDCPKIIFGRLLAFTSASLKCRHPLKKSGKRPLTVTARLPSRGASLPRPTE